MVVIVRFYLHVNGDPLAVARLAEHRHIKSLPGKKVGQHTSTLLSRPLGIALYLIIDELVGFRVYVDDCIISLASERP